MSPTSIMYALVACASLCSANIALAQTTAATESSASTQAMPATETTLGVADQEEAQTLDVPQADVQNLAQPAVAASGTPDASANAMPINHNGHALIGTLGDHVALTLDGDARTGYVLAENIDSYKNNGPNTVNYAPIRAKVAPTLWISEIAQLVLDWYLIPDIMLGAAHSNVLTNTEYLTNVNNSTYSKNSVDGENWRPFFSTGYLQFVTPVGRFRLGRQFRTFGMGLAYHDDDDRQSAFGFLHQASREDRFELDSLIRSGGLEYHIALSLGWVEEPLADGVFSKSDRMRYGLEAGLTGRQKHGISVLALIDTQNSLDMVRYDASLYSFVTLAPMVKFELEAGLRIGTSRGYAIYNATDRSTAYPEIRTEGYRGMARLSFQNATTKKGIRFDGTNLAYTISVGNRRADIFQNNTLRESGTSELACQCMLARQFIYQALTTTWHARLAGGVPEAAQKSADEAFAAQGTLDGLMIPSILWNIGYDAFDAKLGVSFFRAVQESETRKRTNDGGTSSTELDDSFETALDLGWEINLGLNYSLYEHIHLGLDNALFIGSESGLLDTAVERKPAYMIQPRLTVTF